MNAVIGIDIGTTGCKATVFDSNGVILGECYVEYSLNVLSSSFIEQDPNDWWNFSVRAVREALYNSGIKRNCIRAISVSSQGISFVPVNVNCKPLSGAISWLDTRAEKQADLIRKEAGEDFIYGITCKRVSPAYALPKLLWIKQNQSEIYNNTYKFLMAHDFLIARLTGEFVTDHTMAGGSLLYDINNLSWSSNIADMFNIDVKKLPEIKWSGEVVGKLTKKASKELGLNRDVLVCVGAQDQKAAALAASLDYSNATISLGTAGAIEVLVEKPVFDSKKSIPCFTYINEDQWVLEAVVSATGASLKWLRNTMFSDVGYKELDSMAEDIPAGSNGLLFYPHLTGASSPHWNTEARGMFYGLSLSTDKKDIVRSVMEGIGFQIRNNMDVVENLGANVEGLRIFGGGSKSRVWCDIIANITGKNVTIYDSAEIATLGAGILAAKGCGIYTSYFGKKILDDKTVINTDIDISNSYKSIYENYICVERKFV